MRTLREISAALAQTVRPAVSEVYDLQPGVFHTPCVIVHPTSGNWHHTMARGHVQYEFVLEVLVSLGETREAQERIYDLLDPWAETSILHYLWETKDLNLRDGDGAAEVDVTASGWQIIGPIQRGEREFLQAEIPLTVQVKHSN